MRAVTKRELNHQTAQVLAEVSEGNPVTVTERGIAKWRIEAIGSSSDPIARLVAEGRIRPASENPPPWPVRDRSRPSSDVDALLAEMRDDGR